MCNNCYSLNPFSQSEPLTLVGINQSSPTSSYNIGTSSVTDCVTDSVTESVWAFLNGFFPASFFADRNNCYSRFVDFEALTKSQSQLLIQLLSVLLIQ